jgi:hypothetical protein
MPPLAIKEQSPLTIPYAQEVVGAFLPEGMKGYKRTRFATIVAATAEVVPVEEAPYSGAADMADPKVIEDNLQIPPSDRRYRNAEQTYEGIVFNEDEFKVVARNPRDLVKHIKNTTRQANRFNDDRQDVHERVGRAAAHVLVERIAVLNSYQGQSEARRAKLLSLIRDIESTHWGAHFQAKNLVAARYWAELLIHQTAEVASINRSVDNIAIQGMHKQIKYRLYGGEQTDRMHNWRKYLYVVGRHTKSKMLAIGTSRAAAEKELEIYQPYLQRNAS